MEWNGMKWDGMGWDGIEKECAGKFVSGVSCLLVHLHPLLERLHLSPGPAYTLMLFPP